MNQLQPKVLLNRDFIIEWNYKFPIDRWWREKYQIPLFSKKHLSVSQLDICNEYHEVLLFQEFEKKAIELEEKRKRYQEGEWITPGSDIDEDQINKLFDNLDTSLIKDTNNDSHLQFE